MSLNRDYETKNTVGESDLNSKPYQERVQCWQIFQQTKSRVFSDFLRILSIIAQYAMIFSGSAWKTLWTKALGHYSRSQPRRWPQGGQFDQQKNFMKMHHQLDPGRFFDARYCRFNGLTS
jgi:hypothetical protein